MPVRAGPLGIPSMPPGTDAAAVELAGVEAVAEAAAAVLDFLPEMKSKTSCLVTLPSFPVPLISLILRLFYFAKALTAGVDLAF